MRPLIRVCAERVLGKYPRMRLRREYASQICAAMTSIGSGRALNWQFHSYCQVSRRILRGRA